MPEATVPLRCTCGSVAGSARVSPSSGVRLVCMCDDCQTYAHALGHADVILDAHGGTDLFQSTPARITLEEGTDQIRCMRLGPRGPLRFHTGCCSSPIANVIANPRVPFASVFHTLFDLESPEAREAALGPIRGRVNGKFGKHPLPAGSAESVRPGTLARSFWNIARGYLRGEARPSPFFDDRGEPVVEPVLIDLEECKRCRALAGFPSAR